MFEHRAVPIPDDEDARLAALDRYRVLHTPPEEAMASSSSQLA
jgi:hypothetical protein